MRSQIKKMDIIKTYICQGFKIFISVDSCTSQAMDSEMYCLKWNEFEENIRNSFKLFKSEGKFFIVTLASDDGHQIQGHKTILSAGSDFFRNIFSRYNQNNMLVFIYVLFVLVYQFKKSLDFVLKSLNIYQRQHW